MSQTITRPGALRPPIERPPGVDAAVRAALSRLSEARSFVNEDDMEGPRAGAPIDALAAASAP